MTFSRAGGLYRVFRRTRSKAISWSKGLKRVHPTTYVHASAKVSRDLVAGEYVYIGPQCDVAPMVTIGKYSMLGPKVSIVGDDHTWDDPAIPIQFAGRPLQRETILGADVWVGQGATILRAVSIGDGAIIAAGSVVTRNVPAREVWAGVPARKLRDRFLDADECRQHEEMVAGGLVSPVFAGPRKPNGMTG